MEQTVRKTLLSLTLGVGALSLAAVPARAQISFNLTQFSQTYAPGATASWTADFLNTTGATITFLGVDISVNTGSGTITNNRTAFFTNFGSTQNIGSGLSLTGLAFTTTALTGTPDGTYNGTVQVTYSVNGGADQTAQAAFQSIINATVPEPGALALAAPGLGALPLLLRRRRRA